MAHTMYLHRGGNYPPDALDESLRELQLQAATVYRTYVIDTESKVYTFITTENKLHDRLGTFSREGQIALAKRFEAACDGASSAELMVYEKYELYPKGGAIHVMAFAAEDGMIFKLSQARAHHAD